jgi:DNA-binding SARP family transcriptional activator
MPLTIQLFGDPVIRCDGGAIALPRRRTRALVYYLAAHSDPTSREQLLELFWPDADRTAAQQLLRAALHGARKALGSALLADDARVAIAPAVPVDWRTLTAAVADPHTSEALLTAALAAYTGPLLAGFHLPDCAGFADWLSAERERTRIIAIRGLSRLARHAEARGDYHAALDALTRALRDDPLQEDLQRDAMRLHYLAGDRVGAIRRYEQLRDLLDAEMGVPPLEATRAIYDAVVTDSMPLDQSDTVMRWHGDQVTPPPPTPVTPSPSGLPIPDQLPFTGRSMELAQIQQAVQSGQLALIEGAPGIGKTRLAEAFLAEYSGIVLVGVARELEQSLPYQPIVGALRELLHSPAWPALRAALDLEPIWLAEAARLLPELATPPGAPPPAGGRPDETRLWEALARLFVALARVQPVALFIDDIQWADATSLGLIGYVLQRRSERTPLSLIATTRPVEPRTPLATLTAALLREGRLERLSLNRLAPDETMALARSLSPQFAVPLANWLERNAEGNPFILRELVRHARAGGILTAEGALNLSALSAEPVVPQTVYSLIAGRLAWLSEPARRVLDAAVAAGREFEFEVAARAAALSETAALDALDELRALRLVAPLPDGRYHFDHSLTMEVAYREVGEPRHRLLHRRVAEAMEQLHRDQLDALAGRIAAHFAEGGAPERAATYALRAGHQAAQVAAWAEAIGFFEQALTGTSGAQRLAALMALGEAHLQAGASARAAERFREARAAARMPADAIAATLALARSLIPQGRYSEVIDLVRPLDASADPTEAATALFLWGTALSIEGADLTGAAERLHAAETLVHTRPGGGDPGTLAQIRFELGSVAAQQGDLDRALEQYHAAMRVADAAPDDVMSLDGALAWRILARNNLAYHLHLLGRLDEAAAYAREGLELAETRGVLNLLPYLRSTAGEIALAQGDLATAEAMFTEGLALAERLAIPERIAGLTANLGLVAARRGQHSMAVHRLSNAQASADALGTRHLAAQVRIWLAPLLPPEAAHAALAEARTIIETDGRQGLRAALVAAEQLHKQPPTGAIDE